MPYRGNHVLTVALVATVFGFAVSTQCAAQTSRSPQWICSTTTRVRPDKAGTYERYLKRVRDGYSGAGVLWFLTFQTFAGETTEYTTLTPIVKFGDLGQALDMGCRQLLHKMARCYLDQTQVFSTPQSDLNINVPNAGQYWVATKTQVAAGKMNEYLNWLRDDYRPALEKAGVQRFQVVRPIFGATSGEIVTMRMLRSLAEVDSGAVLSKVLRDVEAREMAAKMVPLVSSSTSRILRLRTDLSSSETW